jgi:catechol 2,3-dioxygenase-like lactoylglutathione lyase family enzyme
MILDHVQLAAPPGCEEDARAFFGGTLGLEEVAKPPTLAGRGGVWFTLGNQQLHVGVADDFVAARKAHPAFRVAGVAELERLAQRIGEVTWDDDLPGYARFYCADPWGNRLELLAARD